MIHMRMFLPEVWELLDSRSRDCSLCATVRRALVMDAPDRIDEILRNLIEHLLDEKKELTKMLTDCRMRGVPPILLVSELEVVK